MSYYTWNGVSINWNFWEGCSQVTTRYSNPFQDIIESYSQKTTNLNWTTFQTKTRTLIIIKSYSQKTPNLNWTTFQTKTLYLFLVYSDKYTMQMMQPFSKDLLRRLPRIGIWENPLGEYQNGKRDQNLEFFLCHMNELEQEIYSPQLCWVIYLLGKHSKGRLNLSISL